MEYTVDNNFYKATSDGKGSWDLKPKLPSIVKQKPSGKETPRYPVITEYEGGMKRDFDVMAKKLTSSLGDLLDKFLL